MSCFDPLNHAVVLQNICIISKNQTILKKCGTVNFKCVEKIIVEQLFLLNRVL